MGVFSLQDADKRKSLPNSCKKRCFALALTVWDKKGTGVVYLLCLTIITFDPLKLKLHLKEMGVFA